MHTRGGGGGIEDLSSKGDKELLTGGVANERTHVVSDGGPSAPS